MILFPPCAAKYQYCQHIGVRSARLNVVLIDKMVEYWCFIQGSGFDFWSGTFLPVDGTVRSKLLLTPFLCIHRLLYLIIKLKHINLKPLNYKFYFIIYFKKNYKLSAHTSIIQSYIYFVCFRFGLRIKRNLYMNLFFISLK